MIINNKLIDKNMKNKKFFGALLLIVLFGLTFSNKISASPPVTPEEKDFFSGGLLFGQSHFYSILLRENGEAIVYSKIVVTNSGEESLKEFSFRIPKVSPTEMLMYQMKLPQECVRYDYNDPKTPCLEYQDPNYNTGGYYYYDYGYGGGKTEYKRIDFTKEGDLYSFEIPEEVESFKTTAFIIAFAAKGYVKETMGLYKFQFETIKVPSRIKESRVVVDVDRDLFMKGKRSQIDYPSFSVRDEGGMGVDNVAISNRELDRVVQEIGSYGQLIKEARNLAPDEVLIVSGEYARSWLRLYASSMIKAVLVIFLMFFGLYYLLRFLGKKKKTTKEKTQNDWPLTINNLLISLISALSVFAVTIILYMIERTDYFYFSYYYFFDIIRLIIIGILYILIIFVPPIIVSLKRGWKSFIVILLGEFFWMLFFLFLFFLLFQSGNYYY